MPKHRSKNIHFLKILRYYFLLTGIFFSACIILALTEQPFWVYHWLGTSKSVIKSKPEKIILLGGGGMPSTSNLMRSWYTGIAASKFPDSKIIIAMPGELNDTLSTPMLMKKELIIRGIDANRVEFENVGTNTRAQALNCEKLIKKDQSILLITSPEHMRRAFLCFKKVGFVEINALPAFENAIEADLSFRDDDLGGNKNLIPDVGKNISMRYQLWNHLKYEILIAREIFAILYYKLRGWI